MNNTNIIINNINKEIVPMHTNILLKRRRNELESSSNILNVKIESNFYSIDYNTELTDSKNELINNNYYYNITNCPFDVKFNILSFLLDCENILNIALVSKYWFKLSNFVPLYRNIPNLIWINKNNKKLKKKNYNYGFVVNKFNFQNYGIKNIGTEGTCYKVRQRSTGKLLALKKARVFPTGEGVPYYMLRELSVLNQLQHPNIIQLKYTNLNQDKLYIFFPFIEKTLHDLINPNGEPSGTPLPEHIARRLLHQLLDGIAYCHRQGVLHRNLKPKHLLIQERPQHPDHPTLLISDFALVRASNVPKRDYTTEVVTLWYRPPEILMGDKCYDNKVDIWSIGCIFAEICLGKPLFTGISEIDQLFHIFSKLSTPNTKTWPDFNKLPFYNFKFPNWNYETSSSSGNRSVFDRLFPNLSELGRDLLSRLLTYDPKIRFSAEVALRHPYFNSITVPIKKYQINSILNSPKEASVTLSGTISPSSSERKTTKKQKIDTTIEKKKIRKKINNDSIIEFIQQERLLPNIDIQDFKYEFPRDIYNFKSIMNHPETITSLIKSLDLYALNLHQSYTDIEDIQYLTKQDRDKLMSYYLHITNLERLCYKKKHDFFSMISHDPRNGGLIPAHRSMLVDWLLEVVDVFDMNIRTVYLAMNYSDRFMYKKIKNKIKNNNNTLRPIQKKRNYQLLGATCLHIASKCEDVSYIGVEDLAMCADHLYKKKDILKQEEKVLNTLKFNLCVPISVDFLHIYHILLFDKNYTINDSSNMNLMNIREARIFDLAEYIIELTLQDRIFLQFYPSLIATCSLVLSLYTMNKGKKYWSTKLKEITHYEWKDLKDCMICLQNIYKHHSDITLPTSRKRFMRIEKHQVALIVPPILYNMTF